MNCKHFILALFMLISLVLQAREALNNKIKDELISVFKHNESLHQAFFNYNGKEVEQASRDLKKAVDGISKEEISKLLKFSSQKLSEINASKSRKENNQNYHLVSMALIHLINKYDLGSEYNAYSCPMVKKKWVQNSQKMVKVHNPYHSGMPHCGVQDTKF